MPGPFTTVASNTLPTYTFLVGLGIVCSVALCAWLLHGDVRPGRVVDVGIGATALGLLSARAVHVLLLWDYFTLHRDEITQIDAGGLDWRGAVIGVTLAAIVVGRLREVPLRRLFDALALCLPLMGVLAWVGSGAAHAAYGAEVANMTDHPAWLVWEERDIFNEIAPRYATQRLGAWLMAAILLVVAGLHSRGWLDGRRWAVSLALTAAMMFAIGFLRGDYAVTVSGLRQGQWLDLGLLVVGAVGLVYPVKRDR